MIHNISAIGFYIFKTEVKGERIGKAERFANFLLTPARYFFDGKQIDWVQRDYHRHTENGEQIESDYLWRYDSSFSSRRNSMLGTLAMICLLVSGTLLGGCLKGYCIYKYHDLRKLRMLKAKIEFSKGNSFAKNPKSQLPKDFNALCKALSKLSENNFNIPQKPDDIRLFKIENLVIPDLEENKEYHKAVIDILNNIDLLWNLPCLKLKDNLTSLLPSLKDELVKKNPKVSFLNQESNKWMPAKHFKECLATNSQ